jgi:hypothetical protein
MPSSIQVVKAIHNDIKLLEKIDVELGILDIRMVRFYIDIWPKFQNSIASNLARSMVETV